MRSNVPEAAWFWGIWTPPCLCFVLRQTCSGAPAARQPVARQGAGFFWSIDPNGVESVGSASRSQS